MRFMIHTLQCTPFFVSRLHQYTDVLVLHSRRRARPLQEHQRLAELNECFGYRHTFLVLALSPLSAAARKTSVWSSSGSFAIISGVMSCLTFSRCPCVSFVVGPVSDACSHCITCLMLLTSRYGKRGPSGAFAITCVVICCLALSTQPCASFVGGPVSGTCSRCSTCIMFLTSLDGIRNPSGSFAIIPMINLLNCVTFRR